MWTSSLPLLLYVIVYLLFLAADVQVLANFCCGMSAQGCGYPQAYQCYTDSQQDDCDEMGGDVCGCNLCVYGTRSCCNARLSHKHAHRQESSYERHGRTTLIEPPSTMLPYNSFQVVAVIVLVIVAFAIYKVIKRKQARREYAPVNEVHSYQTPVEAM